MKSWDEIDATIFKANSSEQLQGECKRQSNVISLQFFYFRYYFARRCPYFEAVPDVKFKNLKIF